MKTIIETITAILNVLSVTFEVVKLELDNDIEIDVIKLDKPLTSKVSNKFNKLLEQAETAVEIDGLFIKPVHVETAIETAVEPVSLDTVSPLPAEIKLDIETAVEPAKKREMYTFKTACTVCGASRNVYHDISGFNGQLKLGSSLNPLHCTGDKIHRTVNPNVLNSIHDKHKPDSKGTMYHVPATV